MSKDKKKVDVNLLTGIKEAEKSLAKEEVRHLEDSVPDGHVLKDELEKQKALLGDISDLPPGHPLVKMLLEAKERYETKDEREDAQSKAKEVRQAKKIDAEKAKREREAQRLEAEENRKKAAKSLNMGMDSTLGSVRELYERVAESEKVLSDDAYAKARVLKLKRLLFALERGISECKIARVG